MLVNFSSRAHNHNFATDFIVRSLLDTDWYKLAMLQFIWRHFRDVKVRFSLINRTRSVKLARIIDEAELRRQLDNVRSLRLKRSEAVWLQGNTFYGQRGIFRPEFVAWLADDFALPDYRLSEEDGQWRLDFEGSWATATMWEIYALSIINELKTRAALAEMTETELDILYARVAEDDREDFVESICDYFAGCLLVPRPWLKKAWGEGIQRPADLATRFGVSQQAIQVRLSQTGLTGRQRRCGQTASDWRLPRFPRTGTPEGYHRRALTVTGSSEKGPA